VAYSEFTLNSVQKAFNLVFQEINGLFEQIPPKKASQILQETLAENIPLALASNTEKSRSEMIITPILIELRRQFNNQISIFSGISFNIEPDLGLTGNCDFLISQNQELLMLTSPVITLVEAKKEDLISGLGQCIAEMIAAQIFNERENQEIKQILGVVTSGTNWRFLILKDRVVEIDLKEYYLDNINQILGILASFINQDY
jgi:hypothetical protein